MPLQFIIACVQTCGQGEPAGKHCGHEPPVVDDVLEVDELEEPAPQVTSILYIPDGVSKVLVVVALHKYVA